MSSKAKKTAVGRKKGSKRKGFRISLNLLLVFLALVIVFFVLALLVSLGVLKNPFVFLSVTDHIVNAEDRCSLLAGNLIHSIENEGACKNVCFAECESLGGVLTSSEFFLRENNCHDCSCNCRY